jgi:hypothetical protein
MTSVSRLINEWKHPSPEMMSSIGLSDHQWLLLKRTILLLPPQYSTSHHPLVTPIIGRSVPDKKDESQFMSWYPLLDRQIKYADKAFSPFRQQTARSYHLTPLLSGHNHKTTRDRFAIANQRNQREYTIGGLLAWRIGCNEEQFRYMCTTANNQQLLSILEQPLRHCDTVLNGRALLISWEDHMLWYLPVNVVVPVFPYLPSTPSSTLQPVALPTSSSSSSSLSKDSTCYERSTTIPTATTNGVMNSRIEMSVDECRQWIGHIAWMGTGTSVSYGDQLICPAAHSHDNTFQFRRIADGGVVTLTPPPIPLPPSSPPEQYYNVRMNPNGRQLALISDDCNMVVVYEMEDILKLQPQLQHSHLREPCHFRMAVLRLVIVGFDDIRIA